MGQAQSEVDVANRALVRLGLQTITAASDDPMTFASAISNGDTKNSTALLNTHFDEWKKELLRSHPWNFATTRMTLINPIATNPGSITIKEISHSNPVVIDVTPSDNQDGFDHNFWDYDVVEIRNALYTNLNNNKYYVFRGHDDGSGSNRINPTNHITLFKKLQNNGTLPAHGVASAGNSERTDLESAITWNDDNRYNTGTVNTFEKSQFDYEYNIPRRVIRLLNVKEIPEGDEYRLQRRDSASDTSLDKILLCNVNDMINIEFIEDFNLGNFDLDRSFIECLSLKIAHKLSEMLIKTSSVTNEIQKEFQVALSQAKSIDAQENGSINDFHSTWANEMGRET
tara:strand:- start:11033 stop:12058 length:1026 start_codon:yes stop_codon:yes gene_type:complete